MTHRWMHLRFSAPLMAFGGVAIDHIGPTRDVPAASALTGLLANAMGWRREDTMPHQALQDRLVLGTLIARQGHLLTDSQNAKLEANDLGWTTWGYPEGRAGATYNSPHRRLREYLADHDCHAVLRLSGELAPNLDDLASALERPARPLFIGRKPCLPSSPLFSGWAEASTAQGALRSLGIPGRAFWPMEGDENGFSLADLRNWNSGLHGGDRRVVEEVLL
jgi:CRISPR system Cascade subunit CasD